MPEFAETIEIADTGIKINGEEFPYYIAEGGAKLDGCDGMETLTLTLLTGRPRPAVETASSEPPNPPRQDSMLDAAKLSLKEAERFEASAEEVERSRSNDCSPGSIDAGRVEHLRQLGRDELLLANAQASIAVAEALAASSANVQADTEDTGHTIGTAYVQVRPDFTAFDAAVGKAVKRAEQRLARAVSTT